MEKIIKDLQKNIEDSGVKKNHVAKLLGVDASTLYRILKGKQPYISRELIEKINQFIVSR